GLAAADLQLDPRRYLVHAFRAALSLVSRRISRGLSRCQLGALALLGLGSGNRSSGRCPLRGGGFPCSLTPSERVSADRLLRRRLRLARCHWPALRRRPVPVVPA